MASATDKPTGESNVGEASNSARLAEDCAHPVGASLVPGHDRIIQSFYDTSPMMMGIVNVIGDDIVHLSDNCAAAHFFSSTPEAMAGRKATELGAPLAAITYWLDHYRAAKARGGPVRFEYEHCVGEKRYWLRSVVSHISALPDGSDIYSYVTDDASDRRKIELELAKARDAAEEATRSKSDFLANMSHEIRTPLSGILGMTDLLLEEKLTSDQRQQLSAIQTSGSHLIRVINDILDFSKIEAGKLTLELAPFDLVDFAKQFETAFAIPAKEKELRFAVRVEPATPCVLRGDAQRLQQVLFNLVGNAIKFTAPQGTVLVTVICTCSASSEAQVHFSVSDTGIGIPLAKQAAIFERFTQADNSVSRRFGGSGLGLSICAHLVQLMGGNLSVLSEPGRGSTFSFTVRFPIERPETRIDSGVVDIGAPQAPPARILVAEDNTVNQQLIRRLLEKDGHSVAIAENGAVALDLFQQHPFDLILMDIQMPRVDGFQATEQIRTLEQQGALPRIPIVALTAHALSGYREKCLEHQMDEYLTKPIVRADLRRVLQQLLLRNIQQP